MRKYLKIVIINITLIISVLGFGELFLRIFPVEFGVEIPYKDCLTVGNRTFGFNGPKNKSCSYHKKTNEDRTVYDVTYNLNQWGFRKIPNTNENTEKNIITLGCSFTFGVGVQDSETYPARLQHYLPDYHVHDFSMPGYSITNLIGYFYYNEDLKVLKDKKVTKIIYFALYDHVRRMVDKQAFPLYTPEFKLKEGNLDYKGLSDFRGYREKRIFNSKLVDYFFPEFGVPVVTEKDIELYIEALKVFVTVLKDRYKGSSFVFVYKNDFSPDVIKKISEIDMTLINTDEFTPNECLKNISNCSIPFDGHPTSKFHDAMGSYLANYIKKSELN